MQNVITKSRLLTQSKCTKKLHQKGTKMLVHNIYDLHISIPSLNYCNLSLGLMTKASLQGCELRGKPESVGECENGHSYSQVSSRFESWSPRGLSNF
jgi:hypothetical protein